MGKYDAAIKVLECEQRDVAKKLAAYAVSHSQRELEMNRRLSAEFEQQKTEIDAALAKLRWENEDANELQNWGKA